MVILKQGIGNAPYNCIVQPYPGGVVRKGDEVQCTDPRSGKVVRGECVAHWTFLWAHLQDWFCQEAYGVDAFTLYKYLQTKPEYSESHYVRFCKLQIRKQ